jgi:hypothetical protein
MCVCTGDGDASSHPKPSGHYQVHVHPMYCSSSLRASALTRARTLNIEVHFMSLSPTHTETEVTDSCPPELGIEMLSSSLRLLAVQYPRHHVTHQQGQACPHNWSWLDL